MKKLTNVAVVLSILSVCFASCNKYDEGPAFSLRTKKSRVTNNWVIDLAQRNGTDATAQTRISVSIKDDGSVTYKDTVNTLTGDSIIVAKGLWEFDQKGENLLLVFSESEGGVTDAKVWYILRLTGNELWVNQDTGEDLFRYQFAPK